MNFAWPDVPLPQGQRNAPLVGRAVALECARQGWTAVIVGRRAEPLDETVEHAHGLAGRVIPHVADVSDEAAVRALAERVAREFGTVGALVNSAGINVARRALESLTVEEFRKIVEVNLVGAFLCVRAFLPMMRRAGGGTTVHFAIAGAILATLDAPTVPPDISFCVTPRC